MSKKTYFPLRITPRAAVYAVLLAAAFVLAQLVRSSVTYMTFLFVLLIPLVSAAYLAAALVCVRVSLRASAPITKRSAPVEIFLNAKNRSPLPFSPIHIYLSAKRTPRRGSHTERVVLSLMPFSDSAPVRSFDFPFLGEYPVGIEAVYAYDLFGMIGVRIPCNGALSVLVLPSCPALPASEYFRKNEGSTANAGAVSHTSASDTADIKVYENGDSIKHIHWKLSSKSEELMVRRMVSDSGADTLILCDLESAPKANAPLEMIPSSADVAQKLLSDSVIEAATGAVFRELSAGRSVELGYVSGGDCVFRRLTAVSELDALKPELAKLSASDTGAQLPQLYGLAGSKDAFPIFISAAPYTAVNSEHIASVARNEGGAQLISCIDSTLFSETEEHTEKCRQSEALLLSCGVSILHMEKLSPQKPKYKA